MQLTILKMTHDQAALSQMIEEYIRGLEFPTRPANLYAPIGYSLECGGKRLRPMVVLMACEAFGGDPRGALPLAAAVEVFHNFTLLHDDIMDNAAVRRGKQAVQAHWVTNTAILSGDAMVIYAYKMLAMNLPCHIPGLLEEFNLMAAEVCEGQQYDMDFEQRTLVGEDEYMVMIGLKTAALIARAAKMGAMLAGADGEDCGKMYRFGYELGLAFQVRDDLLDSYGDHMAFGKKVGGDIIEGKKSFLTVTALKTGNEVQKVELSALLADSGMEDAEKVARVWNIYNELKIKEITLEAIRRYTALALDALSGVSLDAERLAPLRELAMAIANREK